MAAQEAIKSKIAGLPAAPGVYIFKDSSGKIIYIGKAKSLKKRAQSYFSRALDAKTQSMVSAIYELEFKLTPSESQALLLEAALVHKYKPRYNFSLRDDKSFPLVKITNEEFPAICITRKKKNDGALYLGPYTSAKLLRQALKVIRRIFPYRSCRQLPRKACMYYRLGLSPAPCIGKINQQEYAGAIKNIRLVLEGHAGFLIRKLSGQMLLRSQQRRYEEAAKLRDQVNTLGALTQSYAGALPGSRLELEGIRAIFKLKKLPERIEAFDISDISGKEACGSMVSFYHGFADKNNYRRFRIKTVSKIDDYDMLREVVRRRYLRLLNEGGPWPDLILIDGGKGHLQAAAAEVGRLGVAVPLASIAKEEENIYSNAAAGPLRLTEGSPALNFIRRIRDEAHRFALAYHHVLHRKKIIGK